MRAFVALRPPPLLTAQLALMGGGIEGARWEPESNIHLTLRFVGDVEGSTLAALLAGLGRIRQAPLAVTLRGSGHFPPRGEPRYLWIGVAPNPALLDLQAAVERVATQVGLEPDGRNFVPHVTLARLKRARTDKVAEFLGRTALFEAPPWEVERFGVFSSVLGPRGAKYRDEAWFDLDATP